jgi:hypothetical protein
MRGKLQYILRGKDEYILIFPGGKMSRGKNEYVTPPLFGLFFILSLSRVRFKNF